MPLKIPTTGTITLTACCERCKDLFTVWGRIKDKKIYIEPQNHIRTRGNRETTSSSNLIPLNGNLRHHCGGRLKFFPDYKWG